MGDIADMMLDGTLCEGCGVHIPGESDGVPRRCRNCRPSKAEQKAVNIARSQAEQVAAKKHPCPTCGKRLRLVGMADHMRDAHPAEPAAAEQAETAQAAPALVDLLMDAEEAEHIERAAGLLEGYVQFIKDHVMSADIEMHPYLPEIEDAAQELRSIALRIGEFTPTSDYLFGHADGLEWAARQAEANDPRTGDWLFDDPHELAKALRKGPPDMPAAPAVPPGYALVPLEPTEAMLDAGAAQVYEPTNRNDCVHVWSVMVEAATPGATHGNN